MCMLGDVAEPLHSFTDEEAPSAFTRWPRKLSTSASNTSCCCSDECLSQLQGEDSGCVNIIIWELHTFTTFYEHFKEGLYRITPINTHMTVEMPRFPPGKWKVMNSPERFRISTATKGLRIMSEAQKKVLTKRSFQSSGLDQILFSRKNNAWNHIQRKFTTDLFLQLKTRNSPVCVRGSADFFSTLGSFWFILSWGF